MKIAVNTRLLLPDRLDGIGRFAAESLKIITLQHPEHEFFFLFDRLYDKSFVFNSNVRPIVIHPQARHPLLFIAWFEMALPYYFSKLKPDLFLSPDGFLSLSAQVKSVSVIHDLNFEHFPDDLPWHIRKYYRYYFPRFARKATRIATVSEFSKKDISEIYHIDNQLIDVVYNGTGSIFKPLDTAQIKVVRAKYSNEMPYFLFVGTMHPRKNLVNLFKAFDLFKQSDNQNIKLLLAGARMWWTSEIENSYNQMQFQSDVIFTGRLSDEELARVTASALAVTYVSYFEGFGIPILEAFAAQVPVITSDITSMPEVAGDAALLIDPFDNQAIANAMHRIANDETLRSNLIHKASERSQMFSWQNTADLLWNCIEKTL